MLNNDLVEIVFKEISAQVASMTVVNSKETALGPFLNMGLVCGLGHVQNNAHAVFVVVALNSLVCIRCVTSDQPVRFRRKFSAFKVLERIERIRQFFSVGASR